MQVSSLLEGRLRLIEGVPESLQIEPLVGVWGFGLGNTAGEAQP